MNWALRDDELFGVYMYYNVHWIEAFSSLFELVSTIYIVSTISIYTHEPNEMERITQSEIAIMHIHIVYSFKSLDMYTSMTYSKVEDISMWRIPNPLDFVWWAFNWLDRYIVYVCALDSIDFKWLPFWHTFLIYDIITRCIHVTFNSILQTNKISCT